MKRNGIKFYPYVLQSGDVTLMLSERGSDSTLPSARISIGSMSSQDGAFSVYERICQYLSMYGMKVLRNTISRIDICNDFKIDIKDENIKIYDEDYIITKSRTSALYKENRKITGMQFGRGDIVLRIYDKTKELDKPENEHKKKFFEEKWNKENGSIPEKVTRVEYQLRKKVLNQLLDIVSLEYFIKNINGIWEYLTKDWFRHVESVVDRDNKNQSKVEESIFWKAVQSIKTIKNKIYRKNKLNVNKSESALKAQIKGLMTTLCATYGHSPEDFYGMINTVQDIAKEQIVIAMKDFNEFRKDFMNRQTSYELKI